MKKLGLILIAIIVGGGFLLIRIKSSRKQSLQTAVVATPTESISDIGKEVDVLFQPNAAKTKALLKISRLNEAKVISLEYEILYETEGLIKGINSGSKPIEVDDSGVIEREIDFGTCSSGVCRYDKNIGKITLVIRFNTQTGRKIFKQEYL